MAESQIDLADGELVSDFEFILPWDVIETCCSLKPQGTSCFVSLNKQSHTSNQLFVSKLEDNSIKIRIRVVNIDVEKTKSGKEEEGGEMDTIARQEQVSEPLQEVEKTERDNNSVEINSEKKEEDLTNDNLASADLNQSAISDKFKSDDMLNETTSDILDLMISAEQQDSTLSDPTTPSRSSFSEGMSTVIIVKKVPSLISPSEKAARQDVAALSGDPLKINKENLVDDSAASLLEVTAPESGFTSVKEKSEKEQHVNKTSQIVTLASDSASVTCELCFQQYESYSHLVRHVRKQHRDCTFVRNYLEEIRPLTITPCPICKRNFTAKSSLDAHLKVSHGGQFVRIKNLPSSTIHPAQAKPASETKKSLPLGVDSDKKIDASSASKKANHSPPVRENSKMESESEEDSDSSVEFANGKQRVKCDVCNESFETRQQALKHQDLVHRPQVAKLHPSVVKDGFGQQSAELLSCQYCDKKFKGKEVLLRHCLGVHFRSNDSKKKVAGKQRRQKGASSPSEEEPSKSEFSEEEKKKSASARKKPKLSDVTCRSDQSGTSSKQSSTRKSKGRGTPVHPASAMSSPDGQHHASGCFTCDLCGVDFNRMTLLVTHARYCRKSAVTGK